MAVFVFWSVLFLVIAIALYFKHFYRFRKSDEPQIVKGNWLLGSCLDFGMDAVSFLLACRKRYGRVFTMRLLNQYITIVMDPHSYDAMTRTRTFDFDAIQKQVNMNVFSFTIKESDYLIKESAKTVRGPGLLREMNHFASHLTHYIDEIRSHMQNEYDWHNMGLREFAQKTAFNSIFDTVFGKPNGHAFNSEAIYPNFEVYHEFFNFLWLGLPRKMFPSAVKALENMLCIPNSSELIERPDCSDYVKVSLSFMKSKGQTEADMVGHNLVYLHVNYNTFRLLFWALYYVYSDEKALAALRDEIEQAVKNKQTENETQSYVTFTKHEVDKLQVLDSVVKESFRLSSGVFMIRYITEDTQFTTGDGETYKLRGGDRVAIYPPAIHKDPEIFEEPLEFRFDRFCNGAQFYKDGKVLRHPIMPFGSLCTGQKLAIAQIKCYLLTVVNSMDLELTSEAPVFDVRYHGHEILPPVNDVPCQFRVRKSYTEVFHQS